MKNIFLILLLIPFFSLAQVVEEVVQVDTIAETLRVIYRPENKTTHYIKKIAVFAEDTSQVAIEKSFTSSGQNGLYKVFYPNGRLKIKTVFNKNKIHGEWTYYDAEGIILVKGIYEEGVKEGYWAYKSKKSYGRYRKGKKHGRWKRKDEKGNKFISQYKHGQLKSGKSFGVKMPSLLKKGKKKVNEVQKDTNIVAVNGKKMDTNIVTLHVTDTLHVEKEYEQAISFLTENWAFRKMLKNHFGTSIKRRAAVKKQFDRNDRFKFVVSSEIKALEMTSFIEESEAKKIVVAKIDTILKSKSVELRQVFSGKKIKENQNLWNNSTDKSSAMQVVFSEVKFNLLRLDVDWTFKEEKSKFKILLFFNDEGWSSFRKI